MSHKTKQALPPRFINMDLEDAAKDEPEPLSPFCPYKKNWRCPEHFLKLREQDQTDLQVCLLCSLQQVSFDLYKLKR